MVEEEQGMVINSVLFLVTVLVGAAEEVGVALDWLVAVAEAEGVTEYLELSVQLQSDKVKVVASVMV